VDVLDAQVEELGYEGLGYRIAELKPDVVGITTMTLCLFDVIKSTSVVKRVCPNAKVVLGGPHVHLFPEETIRLEGVDFLILGEGELSFTKLLNTLAQDKPLKDVPGLVFRDNGRVVKTGASPLLSDLDTLPHPARELVPYEKYTSILSPYNPITTIFTSRGCPYKCTFCNRPHLGKRFRARSHEDVVDEMVRCKEMGIKYTLVYDDTFTIDKKRVLDICERLIKERVGMHWDIRARVDTVNKHMLRKLKTAGCTGIHYGVESGSERILEILNKRISLSLVADVFKETRRAGLKTLAYFMIGCPTETLDEIKMTFNLARKLEPDYVHMTVLTPFPGTEIYRMALEEGVIKTDVWRKFAENPSPDFIPPVWGGSFSRNELMAILMRGYKKFYIRPSYIFHKILAVRCTSQLKRYIRAGFKVLRPDKSHLPDYLRH
jgi:radical SAM superfamily enzyme YgiQ (UPF0313 family)